MVAALNDIENGGPKVPREVLRNNIVMIERLGQGNFGEVFKGLLTEIKGTPGYLVAVKSLIQTDSGIDRTPLLKEAAILAQFNHPHVIGLVGVVTLGDPLLVVVEYCEHGSLDSYLETHELNEQTRCGLAADCAAGLAYLSSLKFVHRDIAARNVLVSSQHSAKISDFGLSREVLDSNYYQSKGGQVLVKYFDRLLL
jgi:serine/threonine protein kinase